MKNIKYNYPLTVFLIICQLFCNNILAQEPAKTHLINSTLEGTQTYDYVARDGITLGNNFSYKPESYTPQKISAQWVYSSGSSVTPYIVIDGVTYTSPIPIDGSSSLGEFLTAGLVLHYYLQGELGAGWQVTYTEDSPRFIIQVSGVESPFTFGGNYNSFSRDQEYEIKNNSFTARINEGLVLDVEYLEGTEIPDADNRTISTNLPVGSTPGSFNVSPTGAATYTIPIAVPPGTAGMQPSVSIAYNSQAGSGLLGMGWNLGGISTISRVPATQYHDNFTDGVDLDTDDRFSLDGNRLMLTSTGQYGGDNTEYKTESEIFVTVTAHDNNGDRHPEYFVAVTRDGTTIEFGKDNYSAQIVDGKALTWSVSKITDDYGNYMTFHYENSNSEFYITEIKYTGNTTSSPALTPKSSVKFFYEDKTADVNTGYIAGEAIFQKKLIHKIRSSHNGEVLREYDFKYFEDHFTQLCEVIESNSEGDKYNSTVFSWNNEGLTDTKVECTRFSNQNDYINYSGDLNGDGRSDILRRHKTNTDGQGKYSSEICIANSGNIQGTQPEYTKYSSDFYKYINIADLNGDGNHEIISYRGWFYFRINIYDFSHDETIIINLEDRVREKPPETRIGDINGDGINDYIIFDTYLESNGHTVMFIYGDENSAFDTPAQSADIKVFGYNGEHYKNLSSGDFNGDGRTDLLVISENGYRLYYNLPSLDYTQDSQIKQGVTVKEADFNTDGKMDLLVNSLGSTWKLYTSTGEGFISKTVSIPVYDQDDHEDKDQVLISDINGDGIPDIICYNEVYRWNSGNSELDYSKWYFFVTRNGEFEIVKTYELNDKKGESLISGDFNGDGNFELFSWQDNKLFYDYFFTTIGVNKINTIADGVNTKTKLEYLPITDDHVYKRYSSIGFPLVATNIPLYVVSKVKGDDGIGGESVTAYKYEDLILHMQGKGFLGFAHLMSTNPNVGTTRSTYSTNTSYNFLELASIYIDTEDEIPIRSTTYEYTPVNLGNKRYFNYASTVTTNDLLDNNTRVKSILYSSTGENLLSDFVNVNNGESEVNKTYSGHNTEGSPGNIQITYKRNDCNEDITRTETFTYLGNGRLETKTVKGLTTSYTYDDFGNTKTITEGTGDNKRVITNTYSTDGRFIVQKRDPLEEITKFSYNNWGKVTKTEDPNGLVTKNEYDAWGRLTKTINPNGTYITKKLDWAERGGDNPDNHALYYTEIKDEDDDFNSAEYYDILGRTVREVTVPFKGKKLYTDTEYNNKGQVTEVKGAYEAGTPDNITAFTYTSDDRVYTETLPTGIVKTHDYSVDNRVETTYSTGEVYSKTVDGSGLVNETSDPGGTITNNYYADGRVKEIIAPGGTVSMTYYPTTGLQQTLSDPDAGTITYTYNQFGELHTQTDARGKVTTLTYDKLGREKTKAVTSEHTITYNYDGNDKYGTLTSIERNNIKEFEYTYDDFMRPWTETRRNGTESFTFSYTYDTEGNVKTLTYPSGLVLTYTYNSMGDLTQINKGGMVVWKLETVNNLGQLVDVKVRGNNQQMTYGYDNEDRLNSIVATNLINFGYTFNTKNQLTNRNERYWVSSQWQGINETFGYDNSNRLKTASGGESLTMTYKNDPNDRIENKSDIGDYIYQANSNHKLDRLENYLVSLPEHSIEYTSKGKTYRVTEGNKVLTITYGVDNQRFKTVYTSNSTVQYTRYFFNTYEKEELGGGIEKELNYIYAYGNLVAIHEGDNSTGETHYVYTDYLGSVRCITSENGTMEHKLSYDAWGNRRDVLTGAKLTSAPTGLLTARGFTGHEHLDNFGLINMNGRVYEPYLGMFLSPDNYVQMPGLTQNFNRYSYCLNNPMMFTDPSGDIIFTLLATIFAPPLAPLAMNMDMAIFAGGVQSQAQGGTFFEGAWKGGVSGALSGAFSLVGVPGILPNAFLQSTINVGTNGITNVLAHDPFFDRWESAAISGFASGAYNGYKLSDAGGLNYWWGTEQSNWGHNRNQWSLAWWDGADVVEFNGVKDVKGRIPDGCVYASLEDISGRSQEYWQSRLGNKVNTGNIDEVLHNAGVNGIYTPDYSYDHLKRISENGDHVLLNINHYKTSGHTMAIKKIKFYGGEYTRAVFKVSNPDFGGANRFTYKSLVGKHKGMGLYVIWGF